MRPLAVAALAAMLAGCSTQPPAPPPAPVTAKADEPDDHEHGRDKMMAAHAGKHHAWLTAHLSAKDGNELDVFFETAHDDADPKPVALPLTKFAAKATRADGKEFDLAFEPAPAAERKGDPAGACSHFVAKAPWVTADDVLTVAAEVEVDGRKRRPTWKGFSPRKYAHHQD